MPLRCAGLRLGLRLRLFLQRLRQKGISANTRDDVLERASAGDPATLAVLHEASLHLGAGLANLVNLLNVRLFILGGGFAVLAPYLMPGIEAALRDLALPAACAACRIEVSRIDAWEMPRGGVALALEGCTRQLEADAAPW